MAAELEPDAALMVRVKRGDVAAFEQLVEKYKLPVISLIGRTLRDFSEAEDLAQNVFVQVYKSAHRYKPSAKFSTWLFTIARNLSLNEIRRRSRHPADSIDAMGEDGENHFARQIEDPGFEAAEDVLQQELEQKISEAVNSLPEAQRTAMQLCREEDLTYEDIASVLGTSLSATKSLIFRARETLKLKLKPYLKSGAWSKK